MDWIDFLDSCGVEYVEGPKGQVRKGHVGIQCPRCRDDEKFHFNIELDTGRIRGCWRDKNHWMSPPQLVGHLAGVSTVEAKRILADGDVPVDVSPRTLLDRLEKDDDVEKDLDVLTWPDEARPFGSKTRQEQPYVNYLKRRGFLNPYDPTARFGLRWCPRGKWSHRILFPLYRVDGELAGWTGRDITGTSKVKYRTHPPGDAVSRLAFGYDPEVTGRSLVLVEGPVDACKVEVYGGPGTYALALLGLNVGPRKLALVDAVAQGFRRVVILLDDGAQAQALDLAYQLTHLDPIMGHLPPGVADPGDLRHDEVSRVLGKCVK